MRARRGELPGERQTNHLEIPHASVESASRERFPEHDPERPDVGAPVDHVPSHLFGRHVAELALHLTQARSMEPMLRLRDTEVDELDRTRRRDDEVLGADVSMHHLQQGSVVTAGLVRGVQSSGDAHRDGSGGHGFQRAPHPVKAGEELGEGRAMHVLHHQVVGPSRLTQLLDAHHIGVLDPRRDAPLVEEHVHEGLVAGVGGLDRLDRDLAPEPRGTITHGEEEMRHPA